MDQEEILKTYQGWSEKYQGEIDKLEKELQKLKELKEAVQKGKAINDIVNDSENPKDTVLFEAEGIRVEQTFWDCFKIINNSGLEIYVDATLDRRGRPIDEWCFTGGFKKIPNGTYQIGNLRSRRGYDLYAGDIIHANIYFEGFSEERDLNLRWETEILIEKNILFRKGK